MTPLIPQWAIEKAIKGGWNPCVFCPIVAVEIDKTPTQKDFYWLRNKNGEGCGYRWHEIALDPDFWQCLGKAMGWDNIHYVGCDSQKDYCPHPTMGKKKCHCEECDCDASLEYRHKALQLLDLLLTKNYPAITSYWEALRDKK